MERYLALQKVLETGSFTKASALLGYSQSAVSQSIASLEGELGLQLLIRSRYGVRLTPEGEALYPDIEKMLLQYQALQEHVKDLRGLGTGIIRIGTISSITCQWLPPLIAGFQQQYPQVQFVFHQGDYTLIPQWIRSGEVDFGFITTQISTELETREFKNGEMLAVLPRNHPLARQDCVTLEQLAREPFIELEEGQFSEPMEAFRQAGLSPDVRYRIHDDYAIMTMVEAGLGVSILAKLVLRHTAYGNVCLPLDPPIFRHLALAWKEWDSLPLASRCFIEYLWNHREELP